MFFASVEWYFCLINRIFYFFLLTLQNVKKKDKNYEEE